MLKNFVENSTRKMSLEKKFLTSGTVVGHEDDAEHVGDVVGGNWKNRKNVNWGGRGLAKIFSNMFLASKKGWVG